MIQPADLSSVSVQEQTGYCWLELQGQNVSAAILGTSRDGSSLELLAADLKPHSQCTMSLQCYRKDGSPFLALLSLTSIQRPKKLPPAEKTDEEHFRGGGARDKCILLLLADITARPVKMGGYVLGRVLGNGAFGSVHLGKKSSTGAGFKLEVKHF